MKIQVGCDFSEFKQYYEAILNKLGETEEFIVKQDPSHLIVWREKNKVIGHVIWHESNTEEHRSGDPRDKGDYEILVKLVGGKKDFVELHEVWLTKNHRGKGYGKALFEFFEKFMKQKGFKDIIYYAYNPAAIAICRNRKYPEACCIEERGLEGNIETMHVFHIAL
ncbi:MAG: GNAT family N-acetyltransferase [Promethearchaeota archaeon]